MTTPSYPELVAATRREGQALLTAAGMGLDVPVPTCGDWDLRRLVGHVGRVYRYATRCLAERATSDPGRPPGPGDDADVVAWCADALDDLVDTLAATEPDTPVWNWSAGPDTAAFWARRMAHESAVHRWDAQRAHEVTAAIGADIASDAVTELVEVMLPRMFARGVAEPPEGLVALSATDDGSWRIRVEADGVRLLPEPGPGDVLVSGTASDLLLLLYGRLAPADVVAEGDIGLLERWQKSLCP